MQRKLVGDRIKECRLERGWTQDDLAMRSGVPRDFIVNLEHGRCKKITGRMVFRLARALRVGMAWLVGYID